MESGVKRKVNCKKIIIFIIAILALVITVSACIFVNSIYNSAGSKRIDKYNIKGVGNDKFYVEIYKVNFPESSYKYVILDNNKKRILSDEINYVVKMAINCIYEDESIRVYELPTNAIIFYDKGQETFKSILINQIPNADIERYEVLRKFALNKVGEGDWKWIKAFSEYLVKTGDKDIVPLLKRYSRGEFSNNEVQNNKNSEYSKDFMQKFSNEVIQRNNL